MSPRSRTEAARVRLLTFVASLSVALASCTGTPETIELHYPPHTEAHDEAPRPEGAPDVYVQIGSIVDARRGTRVGENRTDLGFHTDVIEASNSVGTWVETGLAMEFERAGFEVVDVLDGVPDDARPLIVEGRLQRAYAARRFYEEARLELHAFVRCACHRKILLSRLYQAEVSVNEDSEVSGHAEALGRALQRAAHELAHDAWDHTECDRR